MRHFSRDGRMEIDGEMLRVGVLGGVNCGVEGGGICAIGVRLR